MSDGHESEQRLRADIARLVAIPSISGDPAHHVDVAASADLVAALLRDVGMPVRTVTADGGRPAVIGRMPGPADAPSVLLYAHHDVQPVGDPADWTVAPFAVTERDGRLYGRGSADDKGGIAVHLEALRRLGTPPPLTIAILIEGEEEVGSPTLGALLAAHADELAADVVLAPDAVNDGVGAPSLTTSLRGLLDVRIDVQTGDRAVHSGIWGGVALDAPGVLVRLLASLTDTDGRVRVDGILPGTPPRASAAQEAVVRERAKQDLAGTHLVDGPLTGRLWDAAALSITGFDAPPVAHAANVLLPRAAAAVSIRLTPEQDPDDALAALRRHCAAHAPEGACIEVTVRASGRGWRAPERDPARTAAVDALTAAFGRVPTAIGVGGSIPFVAALAEGAPDAQILVTAVQDPGSSAHGPDESVAIATLLAAADAETRLLARLAAASLAPASDTRPANDPHLTSPTGDPV